ncbi:hypothetical protein BS78_05G255800 [Paspalum vaginatum]|nr:hypothetical protein BS78_05G255800 [Paspalum vaginatum]
MARKMKRQTEPSFSSDDGSAADDMSTEETAHSSSSSSSSSSRRRRRRRRRRRASGARKRNHNMNNQGKVISILTEIKEEMHIISEKINDDKDETSEIHKKLARLTESHNDQSKRLEKLTESYNGLLKQLELRTNDTSDDSAAPRSQLNQGQPRYRLEFKSGVSKSIDKGKNLEIKVALVDCNNDRTVENGPLSSATVELVVISAEFNQHDNQYNWSREDFESNIKKARQGNSGTGDVDQSVTSIVSNGRFNLVHGAKCHNGSKIFSNSSNKKVRLGVMVVSPTEERVLEGLSSAFYVRGHDRPTRQCKVRDSRSNRPWVYSGYQEQNVTMPNMQSIPLPNSTQGLNIIGAQPQLPLGSTTMLSMESSTSALIQQDQVPHWQTMSALPHIGTQFSCDQIAFPVQLIWDRPYVGPSKRRCNLLDQHDKSNNCGLPTTRLTRDNFGSSNIKPKDVEIMQTHRRSVFSLSLMIRMKRDH